MAKMIPKSFDRIGGGATAEGMLFDAIKTGLGNDWQVFSSLQLLTAATAGEGECDFVLVHPNHGLFVIECKGSGVRRNRDGQWQRRQFGRWVNTKNPMTQAQDNIKDLRRKLIDRMAPYFPHTRYFPFVTGHAVAFPRTPRTKISQTPLNWEQDLLLDCDDLLNIETWVMGMVGLWKSMSDRQCAGRNMRTPKGLNAADFEIFINKVLYPDVDIRPSLRGDLVQEKQHFIELSEEQKLIAEHILDNQQLNVVGGAGTGKTILALESSKHLAHKGLKVLLLCYNRALARELGGQVTTFDQGDGSIDVSSFHGLCSKAAVALGHRGLAVPKDSKDAHEFWTDDAPVVLLEAVMGGHLPKFDAVVVDEGQDFLPDWWSAIDELYTPDGPKRRLVFHDPGQDIFRQGNAVPDAPLFRLTQNFRNPQRVGALVNALSELETRPHRRAPVGELPTFIPLPSRSKLIRHLSERISRLVNQGVQPQEIAILTVRTRKNSPLKQVKMLGDHPLVKLKNARPDAITHSTISAYKGLEADIIFIVEGTADESRVHQSLRYVAASRARHRLFLYGETNWLDTATVS